MDAEFAKRWVADLRDPANKQCKSQLFDGTGYCCLGRAAVLAGAQLVPLRDDVWHEEDDSYEIEIVPNDYVIDGTQWRSEYLHDEMVGGQREELTMSLRQQIGMAHENGTPHDLGKIRIDSKTYDSLADANDSGCTFAQIADWIEANHHLL